MRSKEQVFKNLGTMLIAAILTIAVSGCATLDKASDYVVPVVHGKLLYDEFQEASEVVLAMPWAEEDRPVIEGIIKELDDYRITIGTLYQQSGEELVMSALQANDGLKKVRDLYLRGEAMVGELISREGVVVPDSLTETAQSARIAYAAANNIIASANMKGESVSGQVVIGYMKLALRIWASTKGFNFAAAGI